MRFVQILEGPTATTARPIFATGDIQVVDRVMELIADRLLPESDRSAILEELTRWSPGDGTKGGKR